MHQGPILILKPREQQLGWTLIICDNFFHMVQLVDHHFILTQEVVDWLDVHLPKHDIVQYALFAYVPIKLKLVFYFSSRRLATQFKLTWYV